MDLIIPLKIIFRIESLILVGGVSLIWYVLFSFGIFKTKTLFHLYFGITEQEGSH